MKHPVVPPIPDSFDPSTTWCEVRANHRVMRYHRAGSGSPLIVLGVDAMIETWPELPHLLSSRFRTIVPEVPNQAVDATIWLTSLIDGIGVSRAAMIAAERYHVPALELAVANSEAVNRLVLVTEGAAAVGVPHASVPMLILPRYLETGSAFALISRFLGGQRVASG